jgi:hypothetical protein
MNTTLTYKIEEIFRLDTIITINVTTEQEVDCYVLPILRV